MRFGLAIILLGLAILLSITALGFGFRNAEMRLTSNSEEVVVEYGRAQALSFTLFLMVESALAWLVLKANWIPFRRPPMALRFLLVLLLLVVLCVVLTFAGMALSIAGLLNFIQPLLDGTERLILSVVTPSS